MKTLRSLRNPTTLRLGVGPIFFPLFSKCFVQLLVALLNESASSGGLGGAAEARPFAILSVHPGGDSRFAY